VAGAFGIKRYMEEAGLTGTVVLFGCPAEESGYGKSFMARDGVFDDIDAALTWHPMENNAVWSGGTLAVFLSYFRFRGTAAHAAAAPHLGRSALDAAELMNIGVQFLREHVIDSARIHYSYIDAGGPSGNVVQPTAELHYTVRAPKLVQLREIYDRVVKVARGAAMMTDTELEIVFDAACCDYIPNHVLSVAMNDNFRTLLPMTIPAADEALVRRLSDSQDATARQAAPARIRQAHPDWTAEQVEEQAARPFRGDLDDIDFKGLLTASTDVGDVSWVTPTAQIMLACEPQGTPPHSWQWVANGKSALAHQGLLTAGKAIAMTAFDILNDPDLLARAKAEHKGTFGQAPFVSPIPPEVKPR
jgi:amidohydrolase